MFSNDDDDDDDVEEAPIGATTNENSEASSHDAASTSGLEEQETGDPLGEVPAHSAHDPLEFFSGHSLSFDMNRDTHPFDETELSEGSGGQSVSEALNRVDGDVEIEGSPDAQDTMNAEESSNVSSQEAAAGESDGQSGTEGLEEVRSQNLRLRKETLYSVVNNLFGETREFRRVHSMKAYWRGRMFWCSRSLKR